MALESATYISDLNSSNPDAADVIGQGDDHLRLIKGAIKTTFPNITGAVTPTHTELNYVDGVTSAIQTQMDLKAPLASPTFTGTVVLPTATSVGSVSSTELGYLDGVTSAIQTQLDAKLTAATVGRWNLIETLTASASATIQSSASFSSYTTLMLEFIDLITASGGTSLYMRTSQNGGSSYDATATDYITEGVGYRGGAANTTGSGTAGQLVVSSGGYTVDGTEGINGVMYVYNPAASNRTYMTWQVVYPSNSVIAMMVGTGQRTATAAVTNIRFLFSTGNITSGSVRIFAR